MIIMGNEPVHDGLLHKEVWALTVKSLDDEVVWDFPGEAPRVVGLQGELGLVAHPPKPRHRGAALQHATCQAWRASDSVNLEAKPARLLARHLLDMTHEQALQAVIMLRQAGLMPPCAAAVHAGA